MGSPLFSPASGGRFLKPRLGWSRAVSFALVVVLLTTVGGEGLPGLPQPASADGDHTGRSAPNQRWGSAAGRKHLSGVSGNRTIPASLRGRYPTSVRGRATKGRNTARAVAPPTQPAPRFDWATSRERPVGRSAHERVYDNADGTQTTEFSAEPVNYRRADGSWAQIDSRLVPAGGTGDGWRNTADSVGLRVAGRADAPELAKLTFDASHVFAYRLSGAAAVPGVATDDGVTYRGVLPSVDMRLEGRPGGVKETLFLRSPDAPSSYLFPLLLTGLSAAVVEGQVVLTDRTGARRAIIPRGFVQDTGTAETAPALSTGVEYQIVNQHGHPALRVTVDSGWLRDPARRFPVQLDPSTGPPVDGAGADSGMYVQGSDSVGGSDLLVGPDAAAYVRFDDLVSRLQHHTVYGVALTVVNYDSGSCRPRPLTVHPVTAQWSANGRYGFPGPAVGGALTSKSFAHGFMAVGQSRSSCPTAAEMLDLGAAGRNLVQRWANGEQANYGLSLRGAGSGSAGWKKIAGPTTANPPRLYITHTPYNATYAIPQPTPNPPVERNQDGKVKVTVTNRGAEAWAPSTYYLAYRAYDARTGRAVNQQRSASLPGNVARGGRVTLDATIKALEPGSYFLDFTMVRTGGAAFTDHQVPPGRIVLHVFDNPPEVKDVYPPNGYQASTLTPQLWGWAVDSDAPPQSALQFKFEVCDTDTAGSPTNCTNSGYQSKQAWTVPAGRLSWSKPYRWRMSVKDTASEISSPYLALLPTVPQPEITSRIAGAPYATRDREFDAQVGNVSTAAVDAAVATIGPEMNLVRTYNSLDPRLKSAFGAGWMSRYDMRLMQDADGSGNIVVTYPDGQLVRYGRNPDGTYAAPPGRTAQLTVDSTSWKLTDRSGATYQFSLVGTPTLPNKLIKITDNSSHSLALTYDNGQLARAQVSDSQATSPGRALWFTWTEDHVTRVATDAVNGTTPTWTYAYTGDLLTKVCAQDGACTSYEYTPGSHYRTSVLDSKPESYWRLGEAEGVGAASEVAVNLGKDAGTYRNVALGRFGALDGTTDTAATFNGTSSLVELPKGTMKKSRDAAVEVWFSTGGTQTGGPLLGYQDQPAGSTPGAAVPLLYVGTDAKLRGQFATGTIDPLVAEVRVNDGKWHHAVLSVMGDTQTLYLDGNKADESTGVAIDHSALTYNQIGAAAATAAWPQWGSTGGRHFSGSLDDVALYSHPLGPSAVRAHWDSRAQAPQQLSKVTLPSGKVAAEIEYDVATDRVKEYTDSNGGTWRIGPPAVYGGDNDLRRSVQVLDPANRPYLYEYDALAGRMLRSGTPAGLETREEDKPGPPPTTPPSPPVETCSAPDPQDPGFCTIIPGDSGGPVFVGHNLEGMAVRSLSYDEKGFQNRITNETGDWIELGYDDRGNVTSRKSCRTQNECYTSYSTYQANPASRYDPRADLVTETRDGRSASATDNTYRTTYQYHYTGQLARQVNPDGSVVRHLYTNGTEPAVGGGITPSGLLMRTTTAGGETSYAYYANGDLAEVTTPSGLVTRYTYDPLGRKISETEVSDSFANGVTTTYTYDTHSRPRVVTGPVTTDAVTGTRHQQQVVNEYDIDGNATAITIRDLLGGDPQRVTTTEYDEYNRPVRVVDPEGGETAYGYDRFGNKVSELDANGNRYDYAYTNQNKIAEVRLRAWHSDPEGAPATGTGDYLVLHSYSYDFAGRMASDTDAMGRRLEYEYYRDDLLRRVVLKGFHNPDGTTRDVVVEEDTYDGAGQLVKQVEGNGTRTTEHVRDTAGKVKESIVDPGRLHRSSKFTYDADGNLTKVSRTGNASNVPGFVAVDEETVTYTHDASGNVLTETTTAGTEVRTTSYTYDQRGKLLTATDPRGNTSGADKAAYTTSYEYDELGRQVRTLGAPVSAEANGAAPATVRPTSTAGYNTFGQATVLADPLGRTSRTEYDRLGRPVRATSPAYTPPGAQQALMPTTSRRYDGLGNVVEVTEPGGTATRFSYDQLNRLVSQDEAATTSDERAVTRYTYSRTGKVLSATDPTGARTESTYDELDRQVTLTAVERRPSADTFTTKLTLDDQGNVTVVTEPSGARTVNTYDSTGELTKTVSPAGEVTEYGYDFAERQVRVSDGKGRTVRTGFNLFGDQTAESSMDQNGSVLRQIRYGYDAAGNLASSTDPYQTTTTYAYDAANRLVKQVEPTEGTSAITTTFGYDAVGNRTRYTDGRGNSTIYTLNSLDLPDSVIEPVTAAHPEASDRTWTVAYDVDSQPVRLTAPGGVSRSRTYDAAGRLTGETGDGGEAATTGRTFGYDLSGRMTSANAPGGLNAYTYNDRGALLSAAGPSGEARFGYDRDGNLTSRTDAAGSAAFGYDRGRLSSVKDGITGVTQRLSYDAAGDVETVDYGSGRVRTFGYDDLGRLASDTLRNAGGQQVASVIYGFDLSGHLTSKKTTGTAGAGDNTYEYDKAGRLTRWIGPTGPTGYGWDDSGNRIRAGAKVASYDERNRLLSDGDYTYTYTARGTLRSRASSGQAEQFSFDAFDRLIEAAGERYAYDGLDRLSSRNGVLTRYGGQGDDLASDGTEKYARGPDSELLAVAQGDQARLVLSDAHGDVVAGIDPADTSMATVQDSTAYDPFGRRVARAGDTGRVGFQGDWTDPDTGQVDMGARWYNPDTGTFDSRDSVDYASGDSILANRYGYGAGAPLDSIDPDGNLPKWLKRGIHAVGSAASGAANVVRNAASSIYHGVTSFASYAWSGLQTLGSYLAKGANWLYHKTGLSTVVNKVKEGYHALRSGRLVDWAKQQARAAAARAYQVAKQVTAAARKAVATAIKHTALPVLAAVTKPLLKLGNKIVSTGFKLAARVVAITAHAIKDPRKALQEIYNAAAEKADAVVESVSRAAQVVGQFVEDHAAEIAGVAVGAAVGVGCGFAIGWTGVGAVACGALAGAAGAAVTGYVNGERGWQLAGTTLFGAAIGGITGGLASVAGAALGAGARALAGGLRGAVGSGLRGSVGSAMRSAGREALAAGRKEIGGIASGKIGGALGRMRGCNSFAASTAVLMANGARKDISKVGVGDRVMATDPTTGRTEAREVTAVIVGTGEKHVVEITVDVDGKRGDRTATVTATDGHPFWVVDLHKWVNAEDLKPGHRLETADHRDATTVVKTRTRTRHQRVYNLTVDGLHTYYVGTGTSSALVHNCDGVPRFAVGADGVAADLQRKAVVIGEDMDAIKTTARGIGAKWYQAWGKNLLPENFNFGRSLARNERWIRSKIEGGYTFYDIGIDPVREVRSPFYEMEKRVLAEANIDVVPIPRP